MKKYVEEMEIRQITDDKVQPTGYYVKNDKQWNKNVQKGARTLQHDSIKREMVNGHVSRCSSFTCATFLFNHDPVFP